MTPEQGNREWCAAGSVGNRIHGRVGRSEERRHLRIVAIRGLMQRRPSSIICLRHIGTGRDQEVHRGKALIACCGVVRCSRGRARGE